MAIVRWPNSMFHFLARGSFVSAVGNVSQSGNWAWPSGHVAVLMIW